MKSIGLRNEHFTNEVGVFPDLHQSLLRQQVCESYVFSGSLTNQEVCAVFNI